MKNYRLACFVSAHGFGHAARAAAVIQSLFDLSPAFEFEVYTRVPEWFFADSLTRPVGYHELTTDVGLVQTSSLQEDLAATIAELESLYPFRPALIADLAKQVQSEGCEAVLCDIAPLGIAVAQAAGIPSILVENFTWDWIYGGYVDEEPRLATYIDYLRETFESADYHVQTEPVCAPQLSDLLARPVSRAIKIPSELVRRKLGIPTNARMVLVTMGGIPERHGFIEQLKEQENVFFVIPGASDSLERRENVILLPHRSTFYHPDLVNSADAIVGKSGYSTVAEAYHAGVPFGYVSRTRFRESGVMARFIREQMQGIAIPEEGFQSGEWLAILSDLTALPRITRAEVNGSVQVARFVHRSLRFTSRAS